MQKVFSEKKEEFLKRELPMNIVFWVIDRKNLTAVPFIFNKDNTKVQHCLTGQVFKLNNKGLSQFYATKMGVDLELVHIGKLDALTNYLTCGVSLSEGLKKYYEIIKKAEDEKNVDKQQIINNLFMKKLVNGYEIHKITQDLELGIRRLCGKALQEYERVKEHKAIETAVRNF